MEDDQMVFIDVFYYKWWFKFVTEISNETNLGQNTAHFESLAWW